MAKSKPDYDPTKYIREHSDNDVGRISGYTKDGNAVRPFAGAADPKNFPYGAGFGPNGWNRIAYDTNAILDSPFPRVTTGEYPDKTHLAEKPDYYYTEEWLSYNNGKRLEYLKKLRRERMDKVMLDYVKGFPEHKGIHYNEYTQK